MNPMDISLEDARKKELKSNVPIIQNMGWDTFGSADKLVAKWEAGEEGQEEMRNLRQKLLDFIKIIDDKQKEMQEHQKKMEKVQKQDKQKEEERDSQVAGVQPGISRQDKAVSGLSPAEISQGTQSGVHPAMSSQGASRETSQGHGSRKGQGSAPIQLLRSTRIRKEAVKFDPSTT